MKSMTEERQSRKKRSKRHLFVFVAFHVLIILGLWQGDYHETLMNGATL